MRTFFLCILISACYASSAQSVLKPGFETKEYGDLLSIAFHNSSIPDSIARKTTKDPYKLLYKSPESGFKNRWTFFLRNDNVGVINIRGTVNNNTSWLANFYAPMIPATGELQLNDSTVFKYQLSSLPNAAVHAGWTISLGHLAPDIIAHIRQLYDSSHCREFLVTGHSQGGAIAFLLRSYLHYEQLKGNIPADIRFKTYCSAAPKPGNLYYAYDFENINKGGWAFTVVNAADWVPESPFTIQTITDFNPANPFTDVKKTLRKQKFMIRLAGNIVYSKLERKPRKAQRKFEKYLGHKLYRMAIRKTLTQLKEPAYLHTGNYMRAGTPVILMPDEAYRAQFPETGPAKTFINHMYAAYAWLLKNNYAKNQP